MDSSRPGRSTATAWQPFTFAGLAAFASASTARLWVVVGLTAGLLGWAAERYFVAGWFPALELAVRRLPAAGEIRNGRLAWPTNSASELANTGFLRLVVNPSAGPVPGQSADVAVEFTTDTLTAQSLFGYWVLPYPAGLRIPLNQPALEPLRAAWRPHVHIGLPVAFTVGLVALWILTGMLLAPFLRLLAVLMRRDVSLLGCWRLAVVAFGPGGIAAAVGLLLYASHGFRLPDFLVTCVLALVYSLVLLAGATVCLPRRPPASPFIAPEPAPGLEVIPAAAEPPSVEEVAPSSVRLRSPFAATATEAAPENPFATSRSLPEALVEADEEPAGRTPESAPLERPRPQRPPQPRPPLARAPGKPALPEAKEEEPLDPMNPS